MKSTNLFAFATLLFALVCMTSGCHISFNSSNGYSFNYQGIKSTKSSIGSIPSNATSVVINNQFGSVKVIRAVGAEPGWEWNASLWANNEERQAELDKDFRITETISESRFELLVELPEPDKDLKGISSELILRVPPQVNIESTNTHGFSQVVGVTGNVSVSNSYGDVESVGVDGTLQVSNRHGNVYANNIGEANIETTHGNVEASNVFQKATLKTTHGKVTAYNLNGDSTIKATHTDIKVGNAAGNLQVSTTHGNVLVSNTSGDVNLSSTHGRISADNLSGRVTAKTTHSPININGIMNAVDLQTTHDNINVQLLNSDFQFVDVESTHGNVEVCLPSNSVVDFHLDGEKEISDFQSTTGAPKVELSTSHGTAKLTSRK